MAWREHILSIIIPILFWILLVWICTTIWSYIRDAKKWREHEWREKTFWHLRTESDDEINNLEKENERLKEDLEKKECSYNGLNELLDRYAEKVRYFEEYTWIKDTKIAEELKKKKINENYKKWGKKK